MDLKERILRREAKVGVMGLGYVGLPLACELARVGFHVVGFDPDKDRVREIGKGKSIFEDVRDEDLSALISSGRLSTSHKFTLLHEMDVILICVPTPITDAKTPDLSYIKEAAYTVLRHMKRDQLICLESTTYPGTTQEVLLKILEERGLRVGEDFYLAYSPERVDPGNRIFPLREIPKVVGGVTPRCTELAKDLYEHVARGVYIVSSPKVAELSKLLENIFRNVNIALVNEMTLLCDRLGIDVWEVIDAASTKPFGFMSFYPGPGVGGHCIPVDPFYLSWKAKEYDFFTHFIELAAEVNANMPYYVKDKALRLLRGGRLEEKKVFVLGVAFKRDIGDLRNSPALKVISLLRKEGINVTYNDPYIPEIEVDGERILSKGLNEENIKEADLIILITDHTSYDYEMIARQASRILDTRNAFRGVRSRERVVKI